MRNKQQRVIELFADCQTPEEKYTKLIEFGQSAPRLTQSEQTPERRVQGCQSATYLKTEWCDGTLEFTADSAALISRGLAHLLTAVYSGEPPETLLTCPPDYLKPLAFEQSLSPSRANGLYSIHRRMQQEALTYLTTKK